MEQSETHNILAREAQRIIEQLVQQSLAHLRETVGEESSKTRGRFIELENEARTSGHTIVQWPKISEFADEHVGIKKINEYIEKVSSITFRFFLSKPNRTVFLKFDTSQNRKKEFHSFNFVTYRYFFIKEWKTAPGGHDLCWLYATDFIEKRSLEFNNLYIYRVNTFLLLSPI